MPINNTNNRRARGKALLKNGKSGRFVFDDASAPRRSGTEYDAVQTAKQQAERREHILEEHRRISAKWRPKIPEVRKVANFEAFKNRFHGLDEPDYAVEALYASPNLQGQIRHEQTSRRKEALARNRAKWAAYPYGGYGGGDAGYELSSAPRLKGLAGDDSKVKKDEKFNADASQLQDAYLQRIRIQSQAVLGHITSLLNETENRSTPRTFMRPFKPLIYFQPQMKEILATLEEKWGDVESLEEVESEGSIVSAEEIPKEGDEASQDDGKDEEDRESLHSVDSNAEEQELLMDGIGALRDMRCYVEFIDNEVMPLYTQYDGTSAQTVRFEDLWALFRVGDLVHVPTNGDKSGRYHEIWKIYRVKSPEPDISYPESGWAWVDNFREEDTEGSKFTIYAYYIDHDGSEFGPVRHKFSIDAYPGERPIDLLDLYPMRFAENFQELLAFSKKQGANFVKYLDPKEKHQAYNAWTLTRNPPFDTDDAECEILRDEKGEQWRHPDYIESDVIIDMSEACRKNTDWRVSFYQPLTTVSIQCRVEDDAMKVQQWAHGSRSELAFAQTELVQMSDGIEKLQRRENLKNDAFLGQRARGSTRRHRQAQTSNTALREEDLVLLPKRMFAYVLRERRFVPVDINCLVPVRREQGVFENLRIFKDYKEIVRSLVASHFEKKTIERIYVDKGTEGPSQDLIQGKGRGLVVLLHGVPGVGKTATAEAVAMENKKPLFVVTCGDLGLSPDEVERSLTNMFRLAHMWDCVLLLDEADVFLSQRSHADMKRNALVSVFLRVLEYYNGILFLTTNRVGSIDDAFKSRIHMSLYYPPLDKAQTREIFRLNVAKLREIEAQRHELTGEAGLQVVEADIIDFASKHYEENARSTGCWNGRQIRNAFQIASSLAHNKYSEEVALAKSRGDRLPAAPVLDRSLFEKVQMSTQSFDRHMKDTKGVDASLPLRGTFHEEEKY
ncbi:unnamed protein product [Discula destructiva]